VAALVAAQAQEAVGEDAEAQEGAEIPLDEMRRGTLARPCAGEEGLELLADDAVQERLLRRARHVTRPRVVAFGRTEGPALQHCTAAMRRACRVRARGEALPTGLEPTRSRAREATHSRGGRRFLRETLRAQ